ncbi:MAG: hypothetical protein Q7S43_04910 [bacterium]|nr:hypothetical protein [bacterium]
MEEVLDISHGLRGFLQKVGKIEIEELVVPEFYIGGWPSRVGSVSTRIRIPGFYSRIIETTNSNIFKMYKWFFLGIFGFNLTIKKDGSISIRTFDYDYISKSKHDHRTDLIGRVNTLMLFNQLKDIGLPRIIKKVERDARYHAETVEAVKKALEPFIPQIVADKLIS